MTKQTAQVTFKCPDGLYCNHEPRIEKPKKPLRLGRVRSMTLGSTGGKTVVDYCRFCVKQSNGGFCCVLHNETLEVVDGTFPYKTRTCASQKHHEIVEDISTTVAEAPQIPPEVLMQWTIEKYLKNYSALIDQNYPAELATQFATQSVLQNNKIGMELNSGGRK